jgi:threonine/homoserine/homoserine lactone efflux protein
VVTYLVLGATYGFAAGAQPGQLQAYLINRAVAHGWRSTLPAALAPILSDAPIICLVLVVLTRVPPLMVSVLQTAGGVFLLYLAWSTAVASSGAQTAPPVSARQTLAKAAVLNLLNPNPYLGWSLVMGPLCLEAWHRAPSNAVALVAAFYGLMVVVSATIVLMFAMARSLGARLSRVCVAISAVALACFGLYQLWAGASALIW